eukprot:927163-Pyramimonas_sp.AAC.1
MSPVVGFLLASTIAPPLSAHDARVALVASLAVQSTRMALFSIAAARIPSIPTSAGCTLTPCAEASTSNELPAAFVATMLSSIPSSSACTSLSALNMYLLSHTAYTGERSAEGGLDPHRRNQTGPPGLGKDFQM